MIFRRGQLIRCNKDGDIGVVLATQPEYQAMTVYWFKDGYAESEEANPDKWFSSNLFSVISGDYRVTLDTKHFTR